MHGQLAQLQVMWSGWTSPPNARVQSLSKLWPNVIEHVLLELGLMTEGLAALLDVHSG